MGGAGSEKGREGPGGLHQRSAAVCPALPLARQVSGSFAFELNHVADAGAQRQCTPWLCHDCRDRRADEETTHNARSRVKLVACTSWVDFRSGVRILNNKELCIVR